MSTPFQVGQISFITSEGTLSSEVRFPDAATYPLRPGLYLIIYSPPPSAGNFFEKTNELVVKLID